MSDARSTPRAVFQIRYERHDEVRTDATQQFARGGVLVRVDPPASLTLHDPVEIVLVLPDRSELRSDATVIQVLPGHGIALATPPALMEAIRRKIAWQLADEPNASAAVHSIVQNVAPVAPKPAIETLPLAPAPDDEPESTGPRSADPFGLDSLSNAEKIHMALHGSRDERNAILRDRNRALHAFVLKNPQLTIEDVSAMAKNPQLSPDLLKQIAERKEWSGRPAIALALAKNPKTPPEVAIRALDHVPIDALRQMAKGVGALPHVVQAARKKVIT